MSKSKYKNVRTTVDGISFHSKKEAKRYQELKLLEKAGEITYLTRQKRYPLRVNEMLICTYVSDFEYYDVATDKYIVEDTKGVRTDAYKIKCKLMNAINGIAILET